MIIFETNAGIRLREWVKRLYGRKQMLAPYTDEYGDPISKECHEDKHTQCKEENCHCSCHVHQDVYYPLNY